MAIDPSISLGVQTPQVNVQIPQPLQQFGQILSLQGLMQQTQLHQMQMANVASEMQQRQSQLKRVQDFQDLMGRNPNPTPADVLTTLGPDGTKVVQEILANRAADFKNNSDHLGRLGSAAGAILNDPKGLNDFTYQYNVKQAVANGDLDEATGNEMLKHSVQDPTVQTQLRAFVNNTMDAKGQLDYNFTQTDNQHKLVTAAANAGKAQQQSLQEGLQTFAQGIDRVRDAPGWADALKNAPADVQKFYSGVPWGPDTRSIVALAGVKPEPGKTVPYPKDVTRQQIETVQATELAKRAAEMQAYQPMVQSVLKGEQRFQDLPPDIQTKIGPGLILGGFQGFGKLISDAERERLGDYDRAATVLQNTLDKVNDPENQSRMGPVAGNFARNPYATNYRALQSDLVTQQQQLKKFITNGSLRGLTPDTLDKMFPTITTDPDLAVKQINNLKDLIQAEKQQYLRDLSDKVVPAALKGPAGPTPAGAGSGLPGKVHVQRPDGQTGYINKSALPEMAKQGWKEIP